MIFTSTVKTVGDDEKKGLYIFKCRNINFSPDVVAENREKYVLNQERWRSQVLFCIYSFNCSDCNDS